MLFRPRETYSSNLRDYRIPWLAWPSLLSLDAVVVAVAWQSLIVRSLLGRAAHGIEMACLAATVWSIYVADRLLDAKRLDLNRPHTLRHAFYHRHFKCFTCLGLVVLGCDALLVVCYLPWESLLAGSWLAAAVVLYGVQLHFGSLLRLPWPANYVVGRVVNIPKECRVGILFALGVTLAAGAHGVSQAPLTGLWLSPHLAGWACSTFALAILFTCNCMLVARFEQHWDRAQAFDSLATRPARRTTGNADGGGALTLKIFSRQLAIGVVVCGGVAVWPQLPLAVGWAVLGSGGALALSPLLPPPQLIPALADGAPAAFDLRGTWADAALWIPAVIALAL